MDMHKLIVLDLFCGAGGGAIGFKQAGCFVIGVDIKKPAKEYAGDIFIQANVGMLPFKDLNFVDFIFATPPCQLFSPASALAKRFGKRYVNAIPFTRELLAPYPWTAIENVPQAPLRPDLTLVGPQFGLGPDPEGDDDGLWRKRIFELSFFAWQPNIPKMPKGRCVSIAGTFSAKHHYKRRKSQGKPGSVPSHEAKDLMGIPQEARMIRKEIAQAVPPPYAKYIISEARARMRETGYIPIRERHYNARIKEIEALTDTEIPF